MAPLFSASSTQPPLQLQEPPSPSPASRLDETKSIADLLDEISRSPTSPTPPSPTDNLPPSPLQQRRTNPLPMGHAHTQAAQALTANLSQINHLNLSHHQPRPSPSPYSNHPSADEMDWSPTPSSSFTSTTTARPNGMGTAMGTGTEMGTGGISRHRAFNTQNQRPPTSQSFGSAPTEPRKGPFWYRVPPAPTTPAQRVFNPPNQPRLRPSPVDSGAQVGFRFGKTGTGGETRVGGVGGGGEQRQVVAFAEPSFFAADLERKRGGRDGRSGGGSGRGDPRDGLSGMFGEGFSLDGDGEGDGGRKGGGQGGGGGGWFGFGGFGKGREGKKKA